MIGPAPCNGRCNPFQNFVCHSEEDILLWRASQHIGVQTNCVRTAGFRWAPIRHLRMKRAWPNSPSSLVISQQQPQLLCRRPRPMFEFLNWAAGATCISTATSSQAHLGSHQSFAGSVHHSRTTPHVELSRNLSSGMCASTLRATTKSVYPYDLDLERSF